MNQVRDKLEKIDKRLEEIERTYDLLQIIAKEFYESNQRQGQPRRHRNHEKRYRANQDRHLGYKESSREDGGEVSNKSGVSDLPNNTRGSRTWSRELFSKHSYDKALSMRLLYLSLLIYLLLALIAWMTKDIPFLGYYKIK